MHPIFLAAVALVALIAAWLSAEQEDEPDPLPRHLDLRLVHAPWCAVTRGADQTDCECEQRAGA